MDVSSGIDWVTVSAPRPKDVLKNGAVWDTVKKHIQRAEALGLERGEVKRHGYWGYHAGGIAYFENDNWAFAEVPGAEAERTFLDWIPNRERIKITRLDLQVTVQGEGVGNWWGRTAYAQAHHPEDKRERTVSDIGPPDGSYTCYVGSPSSDYLLRIYRKDKESPLEGWPDPTWRYEIRIRKPFSDLIARRLAELELKDRPFAIARYVASECKKRGVTPTWPVDEGADIAVVRPKTVTPLDHKLAWLEAQVSPTVLQLLDNGLVQEVVRALGLTVSREMAMILIRELTKIL